MRDQGLAIRLTADELELARELGGSSGGRGIRRALHFVRVLRDQFPEDYGPVWEVARNEEEKIGPAGRDGVMHSPTPKVVDTNGETE